MRDLPKLLALLVPLAVAPLACSSFSDSSESSSDLISSPITSLSDSSASSSGGAAQSEQVSDFTAAHVVAGGDAATLLREVGALSARNGISDWESDRGTWSAIGHGIKAAGYDEMKMTAYARQLTEDPARLAWIGAGFR